MSWKGSDKQEGEGGRGGRSPGQQNLDAQGSCFRLPQVFGNVNAHAADSIQLVKVNRHHTGGAILIR